jgi:hypothetical protein
LYELPLSCACLLLDTPPARRGSISTATKNFLTSSMAVLLDIARTGID